MDEGLALHTVYDHHGRVALLRGFLLNAAHTGGVTLLGVACQKKIRLLFAF